MEEVFTFVQTPLSAFSKSKGKISALRGLIGFPIKQTVITNGLKMDGQSMQSICRRFHQPKVMLFNFAKWRGGGAGRVIDYCF